MATSEQRDAYRKVILLIMEEIAGLELDPKSTQAVELMNVVKEMETRIIAGPEKQSSFAFNKSQGKPKYVPKKKWQRGPLAGASASNPIAKPPWYD